MRKESYQVREVAEIGGKSYVIAIVSHKGRVCKVHKRLPIRCGDHKIGPETKTLNLTDREAISIGKKGLIEIARSRYGDIMKRLETKKESKEKPEQETIPPVEIISDTTDQLFLTDAEVDEVATDQLIPAAVADKPKPKKVRKVDPNG